MNSAPDRDAERVQRLLADLAGLADEADYLTAKGVDAYLDESMEGRLLRGAGERILIKVATVVEKLPQPYKDSRPDIEWASIGRMRNLIAHHQEKVDAELIWAALSVRVPKLVRRLGLR